MKIILGLLLGLCVILLACSSPGQPPPELPRPLPAPPPIPAPPIEPPALAPPPAAPEYTGGLLEFTISAIDPDGDPLTYSASNLPAGASFISEGAVFDPETRTFSWQTQPGDAGIYPGVCFSVTDEEYTDSECITIIVLSSNQNPTLQPIPLKVVDVDSLITFTLQASDPDGDEIQFFARNLPPGAQFSPPSFSWVPTEAGIWPWLIFGVTDGEAEVTQRAIIAVR